MASSNTFSLFRTFCLIFPYVMSGHILTAQNFSESTLTFNNGQSLELEFKEEYISTGSLRIDIYFTPDLNEGGIEDTIDVLRFENGTAITMRFPLNGNGSPVFGLYFEGFQWRERDLNITGPMLDWSECRHIGLSLTANGIGFMVEGFTWSCTSPGGLDGLSGTQLNIMGNNFNGEIHEVRIVNTTNPDCGYENLQILNVINSVNSSVKGHWIFSKTYLNENNEFEDLSLGDNTIKVISDQDTLGFVNNCNSLSTSVIDNINKEDVIIYPNPVNSLLHIKTEAPISLFKIMDHSGRLVESIGNQSVSDKIDVSHLESGLYYIQYFGENSNFLKSFIKV